MEGEVWVVVWNRLLDLSSVIGVYSTRDRAIAVYNDIKNSGRIDEDSGFELLLIVQTTLDATVDMATGVSLGGD